MASLSSGSQQWNDGDRHNPHLRLAAGKVRNWEAHQVWGCQELTKDRKPEDSEFSGQRGMAGWEEAERAELKAKWSAEGWGAGVGCKEFHDSTFIQQEFITVS